MNPTVIQIILGLINAAIPNVANLVVAIKNSAGTVDVGILLDSADANYQKAIDAGTAWLAANPNKLAAATPAVTGTISTPSSPSSSPSSSK